MPRKANKKANKRVLVQCSTLVDRNAVTRRNVDGVEHIVVSSRTLPDNVVMNGGLYPADEIANSFASLERTLAPVEHPSDQAGHYIPAADPIAIHNFYAGAFNENVRQENGRVAIDKVVNVQEALKTDRGKRLLDRINELETNDAARPIHTSTGVFLEMEILDSPQTNADGQDYTWIARNMVFDHDAILLETVAAAQPHQGVGMGVNAAGDTLDVQQALVTIDADSDGEMSHGEIRDALNTAISEAPLNGDWVADVFENTVVFYVDDLYFSAPYVMEGRKARIVGIPLPVERDVAYVPKTNQQTDGDTMKDLMLKALADAGVTVNADISDDDLMTKYNELLATQNSSDDTGAGNDLAGTVAAAVTNALEPVTKKLGDLETQINKQDTDETDRLADIVGNSDKYPGLDAEAAKKLPGETLKGMAANCGNAHGIPLSIVNGGKDDDANKAFEMPK